MSAKHEEDSERSFGHLGRRPGLVELKGLWFGERLPKKIDIWRDCGLPLQKPIPGTVSFGFGHRSRQMLLAAAREYATKKRLEMLVINIIARPLTVASDIDWTQFGQCDLGMVNVTKVPRSVADALAKQWMQWLQEKDGMPLSRVLSSVKRWDQPTEFVARFPHLVPAAIKKWRLQALVHPLNLEFGGDTLIMVATMAPKALEIVSAEPAVMSALPGITVTF